MLPAGGYVVYVLVDPRDRLPFYVGLTCRPHQRWNGHRADPASSAYLRLRELRRLGLKCHVRLVRVGCSLAEGAELERQTIAALKPTLLNWRSRPALQDGAA